MRFPSVHFNGTSRATLIDGYRAAVEALREAEAAVGATAPNARDYYPQGGDAFTEANREHVGRLVQLREVRAGMELLLDRVSR